MNLRNSGQRTKFPSTDFKKTVTILKCFLCNQLFYAQNAFDAHMKHHQSKINRNIPEQMQRKTMTTLRNSKNKGLDAVEGRSIQLINNQYENNSKVTLPSVRPQEINTNAQEDQDNYEKQQIEECLRESTLLLQKLEFLTEVPQPKSEPIKPQIKTQIKAQIYQKDIKEQKLISFIEKNGTKDIQRIQNMVRRTEFTDEELHSYQQQIQYLSEVQAEMQGNKQIQALAKKILSKIIREIQAKINSISNSSLIYNQYCQMCSECLLEIALEVEQFIKKDNNYYHKGCLNGS